MAFSLRRSSVLLGVIIFVCNTSVSYAEPTNKITQLSSKGAKALTTENYPYAISIFGKLLELDPKSQVARQQLALACSAHASKFEVSNPKLALNLYHQAAFNLRDDEKWTSKDVNRLIEKLGKKPASFDDRVELGSYAVKNLDYYGGYIEYKQALALKDDATLRAALAALCAKLSLYDEAIQQAELSLSCANLQESARKQAVFALRAAKALKGDADALKEVASQGFITPPEAHAKSTALVSNVSKKEMRDEKLMTDESLKNLIADWKRDRTNPSLCFLIGCIYRSQQKYSSAIKFLNMAVRLAPSSQAKQVLQEVQETAPHQR